MRTLVCATWPCAQHAGIARAARALDMSRAACVRWPLPPWLRALRAPRREFCMPVELGTCRDACRPPAVAAAAATASSAASAAVRVQCAAHVRPTARGPWRLDSRARVGAQARDHHRDRRGHPGDRLRAARTSQVRVGAARAPLPTLPALRGHAQLTCSRGSCAARMAFAGSRHTVGDVRGPPAAPAAAAAAIGSAAAVGELPTA